MSERTIFEVFRFSFTVGREIFLQYISLSAATYCGEGRLLRDEPNSADSLSALQFCISLVSNCLQAVKCQCHEIFHKSYVKRPINDA